MAMICQMIVMGRSHSVHLLTNSTFVLCYKVFITVLISLQCGVMLCACSVSVSSPLLEKWTKCHCWKWQVPLLNGPWHYYLCTPRSGLHYYLCSPRSDLDLWLLNQATGSDLVWLMCGFLTCKWCKLGLPANAVTQHHCSSNCWFLRVAWREHK